jgi:hypothetical protein
MQGEGTSASYLAREAPRVAYASSFVAPQVDTSWDIGDGIDFPNLHEAPFTVHTSNIALGVRSKDEPRATLLGRT